MWIWWNKKQSFTVYVIYRVDPPRCKKQSNITEKMRNCLARTHRYFIDLGVGSQGKPRSSFLITRQELISGVAVFIMGRGRFDFSILRRLCNVWPFMTCSSAWLCHQSSWNQNVASYVVRVAIISEHVPRICSEFWVLHTITVWVFEILCF